MTRLEDLFNEIFDYLHALDILRQTILTYQPSSLRSLDFVFYFNHSHLTTGVTLNWILTSMTLTFYGLPQQLSIYCVLYVFHIYRALRRLRVFILIPANSNIQHA
ncbi:unnamed protein product [Rotaria sp. Silwood1]|nr:unnamed protein product [Rotaria sp. Silwood1]